MNIDPHVAIRWASVYVPIALTVAVCAWRRPDARTMTGVLLAVFWNTSALLALNVAAQRLGWWTFDAEGGLWLGMPVDLYLAWIWLWGGLPVLACGSWPLPMVIAAALALDLALMPAAAPVVQLGPAWLVGEALGVGVALVPGLLLARWTVAGVHLERRALLQVAGFSAFLVFVLPAIVIEGSGAGWNDPGTWSTWRWSLIVQILALPAVVGLSAVQEFVMRGDGTPVPFDPPRRLVTSGLYAYVRSPMQLSAMLLLALLGAGLGNWWIGAAAIAAHVYAAGLAGWDEGVDLEKRFGARWLEYRRSVPAWIPRLRPFFPADAAPATLFVSDSCGMCSEVGSWFAGHQASHLRIEAAGQHPSRCLTRITYEPGDGGPSESGLAAVGRALEHVHVGWALVGCAMRLPVVCQALQLLVDASGGHARPARQTG